MGVREAPEGNELLHGVRERARSPGLGVSVPGMGKKTDSKGNEEGTAGSGSVLGPPAHSHGASPPPMLATARVCLTSPQAQPTA